MMGGMFGRIAQNLGFGRGQQPADGMGGGGWMPGADPLDAGDPFNPANVIAGAVDPSKGKWQKKAKQGLMALSSLATPPDPMQGMGPAPRPGSIVRGLLG